MSSETLELHLRNIAKKVLKKDYNAISDKIRVFRNENLSVSSGSRDKDFGDYSSNILFLIAKIKKINPQEALDLLKKDIEKIKNIKKVEFINGYLNLFLDEKVFLNDYSNVLKKFRMAEVGLIKNLSAFTQIFNVFKSKPIIIDYVSANPTGPLTLGNARGAVIGDCLSKIFKLLGAKTIREYYVNDRGFQIETLGKSALAAMGEIPEEEGFYKGEYLNEITTKFKGLGVSGYKIIGKMAADVILNDYIKPSLKNFGVEFDNYFLETDLYKGNLHSKVFNFLKKRGFIGESDGAVWLLLTKIGEQKDEVIVKTNGEHTYFWSDILYHYNKFFTRKSSVLLIVSADHFDHIRRLRAVFEKIFKVKPSDFKAIIYQMVHLAKGDELIRMSKRKGIYVTLDDLIKEVGLDSVKFFFLKYANETTVEFDMELAKKNSEENPVWYLHYAYVRLKKILERAGLSHAIFPHRRFARPSEAGELILGLARPSLTLGTPCPLALRNALRKDCVLINNPNYRTLFRKIHQFPDLISDIAKDLRPNLLPQYLSELAKMIHNFYEKEKIVGTENEEQKLLFVAYLMKILGIGFYLTGIEPKDEL